MKRYILTGTPSCGKTSILRVLEMRGHFVVEEAATDIIAYDQANGITEPWKNPAFIDNIIRLQKQRQRQVDGLPAAVLKGEQGKPDIRPQTKDKAEKYPS